MGENAVPQATQVPCSVSRGVTPARLVLLDMSPSPQQEPEGAQSLPGVQTVLSKPRASCSHPSLPGSGASHAISSEGRL